MDYCGPHYAVVRATLLGFNRWSNFGGHLFITSAAAMHPSLYKLLLLALAAERASAFYADGGDVTVLKDTNFDEITSTGKWFIEFVLAFGPRDPRRAPPLPLV